MGVLNLFRPTPRQSTPASSSGGRSGRKRKPSIFRNQRRGRQLAQCYAEFVHASVFG